VLPPNASMDQATRLAVASTTSQPSSPRRPCVHRCLPSGRLPVDADPADADLRRVGHRLARHQPDMELVGIQGAVEMQFVDDVGDSSTKVSPSPACWASASVALRTPNSAMLPALSSGCLAGIVAVGHVDVDAEGGGVVEAADIFEIEEDPVGCGICRRSRPSASS